MKLKWLIGLFVFSPFISGAQVNSNKEAGMFSLGLRNSVSLFNGGGTTGPGFGTGGQFRIRFGKQINTEWYADFFSTNIEDLAARKDAHIGWSVFYYPFKRLAGSETFIQPFVEAGHCFDYSKITVREDQSFGERWSSAVQMGIGNHFNISPRADFTFKAQYMLHLGTDLHTHIEDGHAAVEQHNGAGPEGHLLLTLSVNYKLFHLW